MTEQLDQLDAQRVAAIRQLARDAEPLAGPDLLALILARCHLSQADLARLSGITANTLTAIKQGQRLSASTRSALLWGAARALGL